MNIPREFYKDELTYMSDLDIIYTVGKKEIYDPYIKSDPKAAKAEGGSVWKTKEDAEEAIKHEPAFAVYGVVAHWDDDTYLDIMEKGWRTLKKDSKLIFLDNNT